MAKKVYTVVEGASGETYKFEAHNKDTEFEDVSAVYIFMKFTENNTFKILYIGQTGELGTRIANHDKWTIANEHGCTHICVHETDSENDRWNIETDLIRKYNTPCNEQ